VSHPYLSRIPVEDARSEIELSRSRLQAATGREIRLLAFPYGDYNQPVAALCKEAHLDFVYSIEPRPVDLRTDEFVRGRVSVEPDDRPLEFFLKMSGSYQWIVAASRLKRFCGRRWRELRRVAVIGVQAA
jgi:peptidoglycan/xylan/chitin deacetylase (PgdA/CDA1 family)